MFSNCHLTFHSPLQVIALRFELLVWLLYKQGSLVCSSSEYLSVIPIACQTFVEMTYSIGWCKIRTLRWSPPHPHWSLVLFPSCSFSFSGCPGLCLADPGTSLCVCVLSKICCCYCPVVQSCPTLWGPMGVSTPDFPVLHNLSEFAHVHWVHDAIQPSHSLSPLSPPSLSLS